MRVFSEPFPAINLPFVLCIGKFDGLHIGHRLILDTLLEEAGRLSAASVVYSFEPRNGTPLLTAGEEKRELFAALGIAVLITVELGEELMAMTAEQFVEKLAACGDLKAVAVGEDFRFGRGAAGDVALLQKLGQRHRFGVHAIRQVQAEGQAVSSTLIRECVKQGNVERAAQLLGREYSLSGEVVYGRQLGRQLGFRTANILPPAGKVMPSFGEYACWVDVDGKPWPAMANIGIKPTIDGSELLIESHLIGFEGDLYGKRITVRLVKKIRDEIRFTSIDMLAEQLMRDKDMVQHILS